MKAGLLMISLAVLVEMIPPLPFRHPAQLLRDPLLESSLPTFVSNVEICNRQFCNQALAAPEYVG